MTLTLQRLRLEHFKGIEALDLELRGRSCTLYGDNGTGKSTIYDAYIWLLTGKDSLGRVDFEIKPLGADGQVRDHAARSIVEATLDADGTEITLRREFYEKWSKKRGSAEATYDGNTTDYFVDDVPMSKGGYEERVAALAGADLLRLLSDPAEFARRKWQDRRGLLYQLAELPTDREILERGTAFRELEEATRTCSLPDLLLKLKAQRKKINARLGALPALIGENRRSLDTAAPDEGLVKAALADLEEEEHRLTAEIARAEAGQTAELEAAATAAQAALKETELKNREYRLRQEREAPDRTGAEAAVRRAAGEADYWEKRAADQAREAAQLKAQAAEAERAAEALRAEWREAAATAFSGEQLCPTCGQPLPKTQIDEARARFEAQRAAQLAELQRRGGIQAERGKLLTARAEEAQTEAQEAKQKGQEARAQETAAREALAELRGPEIQDLPEYAQELERGKAALTEAQAALTAARANGEARLLELRKTRAGVRGELAGLRGQLARLEALAQTRARIGELEQERTELAGELARVDQLTDQAEEFTREKARQVTERVNGLFRMTEFRLFAEQINGGLAECCEILSGGVPYDAGLNNGARINVGLDVLDVLQRHFGHRLPVFVDNAEAVTALLPVGTQIVRLRVSQNDKNVRCEYEG